MQPSSERIKVYSVQVAHVAHSVIHDQLTF